MIEHLSAKAQVSMDDEWFDYVQEDHFWIQWRFHILERYLNLIRNTQKPVLEIGCGNGIFRHQLESKGFIVDGCDLNLGALEKAEQGKGRLMVYDILEQRPDLIHRYPAVFLMDTLEHITDDRLFLEKSISYLEDDGLIFIHVPASMLLYSEYDRTVGHIRRYDYRSINALFDSVGLEIVEFRYWGVLLWPIALLRKALSVFMKSHITKKGIMPPNAFIHTCLKKLQTIEDYLPNPRFGSSLLAIGRVKKKNIAE